MSYEYLVKTKEELIDLFGEPIDTTPAPVEQLFVEGWPVDENGKDITNYMYGKQHSEATKKQMSETKKALGLTGKNSPIYKHGLSKDPEWKKEYWAKNRHKYVTGVGKGRGLGTAAAARKTMLTNNPANNKYPCSYCDREMNKGNLSKHMRKCDANK